MVPVMVLALVDFIRIRPSVLGQSVTPPVMRSEIASAMEPVCVWSQYRILSVLPTRVKGAPLNVKSHVVRMRIAPLLCYHLADESFAATMRVVNVLTGLF